MLKEFYTKCFLLIKLLVFGHVSAPEANPLHPWLVYYSNEASLKELEPYQLLIFDSHHHPELEPLRQQSKHLLGYLSLGEVERQRDYFKDILADKLVLEQNPNWPASHYVDVRKPEWSQRVRQQLIPEILAKGFHGVFLDTLDNPPHLERTDPEKYAGMTDAAIQLVQDIRKDFPQITIMLNRGYDILPAVANQINMVVGESVYSKYNFVTKAYELEEPTLYQYQVQLLQKLQKQHPSLIVYTLDYWNPDDSEQIEKIHQRQKDNGFFPYVSTVELNKVF